MGLSTRTIFALALAAAPLLAAAPAYADRIYIAPAPPGVAPFHPYRSGRGVETDPGSDNRYFSDTKEPSYILGPAFDADRGGYENLPGHQDVFMPVP